MKLPQFSYGGVDRHWDDERVDVAEAHLKFGSKPTGYKAIVYGGELAGIVSDRYLLLPNEVALKTANEVAKLVGAVPMQRDSFKGDWIASPLASHVIEENHRMHALYAFGEPVKIYGDKAGDRVYMGFSVHNSIDGTLGFGVAGTTFRQACSNMVFFGTPRKLDYKIGEHDQGETLSHLYVKHVVRELLKPERLKKAMLAVIESAKEVVRTYELWTRLELNVEIANRIAKAVPQKYLPEYFVWNKQQHKVAELTGAKPVWAAYNDITAALWHNTEIGFRSKRDKFERLERAMPLNVEAWEDVAHEQKVKP